MSQKIVMNPSPTLGIQVEIDEYRALSDHAWCQRISLRQLIRGILAEWLERQPRPQNVPQKASHVNL